MKAPQAMARPEEHMNETEETPGHLPEGEGWMFQ